MHASDRRSSRSWFRSGGGRRFGLEIALIVVGKLILLIALWQLVIKPQPRADTSPAAVRQHFTPTSPATETTP